jgi:hypothetical protein
MALHVGRQLVHGLASAAGSVAAAIAECNHAQRRLAELRQHPDLHTLDGDTAPQTYAEFLFRSPGTLWREPPAREREGGRRHTSRR